MPEIKLWAMDEMERNRVLDSFGKLFGMGPDGPMAAVKKDANEKKRRMTGTDITIPVIKKGKMMGGKSKCNLYISMVRVSLSNEKGAEKWSHSQAEIAWVRPDEKDATAFILLVGDEGKSGK